MNPNDLPSEWRWFYEERAGIREYMGNQTREVAEAAAMKETIAAMTNATTRATEGEQGSGNKTSASALAV